MSTCNQLQSEISVVLGKLGNPSLTKAERNKILNDYAHLYQQMVKQGCLLVDGPPIPGQHNSSESEIDPATGEARLQCLVTLTDIEIVNVLIAISTLGFGPSFGAVQDLGPVYPEWVSVEGNNPVILEGEVVGLGEGDTEDQENLPHVSHDDWPTSHYTHDFDFKVRPDVTSDHRYTNLLGLHSQFVRDPCQGDRGRLRALINDLRRLLGLPPLPKPGQPPHRIDNGGSPPPPADQQTIDDWHTQHDAEMRRLVNHLLSPDCKMVFIPVPQQFIGVEWETGLGANNEDNPCRVPNIQGNSCGFFSTGHQKSDVIWNWPTVGDHVHIEGHWIWDRGHPPADAEIHPPRLIAIQRRLPSLRFSPVSTRVDIFANGDGGAFNNNRFPRSFVEPVPMSDRNYSFFVEHPLPRPSNDAQIDWTIETHNGDTFPGELAIEAFPDGTTDRPTPHVKIAIPWNSQQAPDNAVFARTVYLFWNQGLGVPRNYGLRVFQVFIDELEITKDFNSDSKVRDFLTSITKDGTESLRLFVDVGGTWFFLNELFGEPTNILDHGLGIVRKGLHFSIKDLLFNIAVQPGGSFRVHSAGWLANGVNKVFGNLLDPNSQCETIGNVLNDKLFTLNVLAAGGADDPVGEINSIFSEANGFGIGEHIESSRGKKVDNQGLWTIDPNDFYRLHYRIQEVARGN